MMAQVDAQVDETSVTNNSSFQNCPHPDNHTIRTTVNRGVDRGTIHGIDGVYHSTLDHGCH